MLWVDSKKWLVPLLVGAAMSAVAFSALLILTARVQDRHEAQVTLSSIETDLNALQAVPWSLLNARPPSTAEVEDQLIATKTRLISKLAELGRAAPIPALAAARSELDKNFAVNDQIMRAIVAGHIPQTAGLANTDVDTQRRVQQSLDLAGSTYRAQADTAETELVVVTSTVIGILFAAFGFFYYRSLVARRAAERRAERLRELAAELRRNEKYLRDVQRMAGVGSWTWNIPEHKLSFSDQTARLHGCPRAQSPHDGADALEFVLPEDRERVRAALRLTMSQGLPTSVDYWTHAPSGDRLIHVEAHLARSSPAGQPELIGTCQDITHRFRMHQIQRANRAKSEFISRMSHELRTPLNAILGFTELQLSDEQDELKRANAEHVMRAARHLTELINETLELSRIESGRVQASTGPVEIRPLIDEVIELVTPMASKRGISVVAEVPRPPLVIDGDPQRLKQTLLNLVSNAIKYNRESGHVEISARPAGADRARISVTDDGPGIAPAMLDRLFTPFERLGAETTRVEGTGLGLVLSKRMVESMAGTISIATELGAGTSFTIELKRSTPALSEAA